MDEVKPLLRDQGGLSKVLTRFYLVQAMRKGYDVAELPTNGPNNFNYDTYDIADGTYILTCRMLESLSTVLQPGNVPLYKDGMFGHYDPQSDRTSKSGLEKFEEDRVLLVSFFTELVALDRVVGYYPVKDEFLRGVKELSKTGEISFCLVFAAQIFLDIHHTVRAQAARAFGTLETNLNFFDKEIDQHLEYHSDIKIRFKNWAAENTKAIQKTQTRIRWVLSDPVFSAKLKAYAELGQPVPASMERNRILKMSPVLSGLMLYHFRAEFWDGGIAVANAWGSITYSLHLYNALQSEKLMSQRWSDMDLVTTVMEDTNFFVGGAPTDVAGYLKKFCLQMGATAATFSRNQRRNTSVHSRSGPRTIKEGAPVSAMFMGRYLRGTGQVDWTAEHVAEIVELGLWETKGSEEEGTLRLGKIEDPEELKQKKKKHNGPSAPMAKLHPEQLIRSLSFALQGESLEFALPYTAMHRKCWSLLRAVRTRCDPLPRQMYTPACMEQESELPFVVGWIFSALVEGRGTKVLEEASIAVDEYVRAEGSDIIDLLGTLGMPVVFREQDEDEDEV